MEQIKIVIVDDQSIIRDGLKMILELEEDLKVIGLAVNGEEALTLAKELNPDVMLMDIRMPIMDGVKATQHICEKYPHIKIIILTTFNDDAYIFDALMAGAKGYMLKDVQSEELANAIRTVMKGGVMIHPNVAEKMVKVFSGPKPEAKDNPVLTQRENEVVQLIRKGRNNKEIALDLFLSEGTVKNHITNILNKLNLRDRTQIALYNEEDKQ